MLLFVMLLFAVSCGDSQDSVSVRSDFSQEEIIGTWQTYTITMDTGDGEKFYGSIEDEILTLKFTKDSIYSYTSINGKRFSNPYVFKIGSISYESFVTDGEILRFDLEFREDELVMKRNIASENDGNVLFFITYSRRVD